MRNVSVQTRAGFTLKQFTHLVQTSQSLVEKDSNTTFCFDLNFFLIKINLFLISLSHRKFYKHAISINNHRISNSIQGGKAEKPKTRQQANGRACRSDANKQQQRGKTSDVFVVETHFLHHEMIF